MSILINFILLVGFTIVALMIFTDRYKSNRCFDLPDMPGYSYVMGSKMYFIIFIVCTAPFFLGQFSLIKYAVYWGIILFLWIRRQLVVKLESITVAYLIFYGWLIISCFYTEFNYNTVSLLIKYSLPILSLWLGYNAIESHYDLYYFARSTTKACLLYGLVIGGFSAVFLPWLYYYLSGHGILLAYAGLADYFTSLFVVPLVLSWITGRKIYLLVAIWMLLSTILESVRTGLGGILLVTCFYAFFRFKFKSIPIIAFLGLSFISVVLFVPGVNEKFFGDKAGTIDTADVIHGNALSLDNIQTSGREFLWDLVMDRFYEPSPIIGSGLGSTTDFLKERAVRENTIALLHSDYVQILCDNGIIGLVLLIIFFLCVVLKVFKYTWVKNADIWVRITGIMAIASMAGTAFSMGFDNVVSHSMTSLINPFIFIGFFLKYIDLAQNDQIS